MKLFTVPNVITAFNALCGCLSVAFASIGLWEWSFYCIIAAAVFDFFDGFAARLLRSYSEIGKQLDSLADVISFGLAPSFMLFRVLLNDGCGDTCRYCSIAIIFSPFLLTVFSALRLAKFNVDTRQTTSFIGLPTPANALFFSSLALLYAQQALPVKSWYAAILVVWFSFLLVSEFPMFSLKIQGFSLKKYGLQYVFLLIAFILLILWQIKSIPFIIITYILFSLGMAIYNKIKQRL